MDFIVSVPEFTFIFQLKFRNKCRLNFVQATPLLNGGIFPVSEPFYLELVLVYDLCINLVKFEGAPRDTCYIYSYYRLLINFDCKLSLLLLKNSKY